MIEAIAEKLLIMYGGDTEEREEVRETSKMGRLKAAKHALEAVLEAGMVPPPYLGDRKTIAAVVNEENGQTSKGYFHEYNVEINEWEKEDWEQK